MCVESTLGVTGLAGAVLFLFLGFRLTVDLHRSTAFLLFFSTLVIGFLMKDFVLHFSPLAVRRDPDHLNIIVGLR